MLSKMLGLALVAVSLGGCSTYRVSRYAVSVANAEAYRRPDAIKVKVVPFTADGDATKTQVSCRMVGPITTPGGETFAAYLQGAMTDELKVAGLYDEAAPVTIQGHLAHLGFSSMGEGTW